VDPITRLNPATCFMSVPSQNLDFQPHMSCFFLTFNDLGGRLLFVFFYMGEIVDHYCLNFVSFHYYFVSKYSLFCMPHVAWIYNYLCNQCLSHQSCKLEPRSWWGVLDTALCDKVCQWLATNRWFLSGYSGFLHQ
jgi:hypothetical protein